MQKIASRKEFWVTLGLGVWLGTGLGLGFQSASLTIFREISDAFGGSLGRYEILSFPLFAFLLFITVPQKREARPEGFWNLFRLSLLPLLIALIFGVVKRRYALPSSGNNWMWICLAIPLGEECLFRGWVYRLVNSYTRGAYLTATNPLPAAVWASSLAFSLWHIQNAPLLSSGFLAFQLVYTFWAGVWLGVLRWQTGGITVPILAHAAINWLAECTVF